MQRNRIRRFILCALCILQTAYGFLFPYREAFAGSKALSADPVLSTAEYVSWLIEELISSQMHRTGADSLQDWVDGTLAETADGTGGWVLIALRQNGRAFDDGCCREKLGQAASEEIRSITVPLRMSLTGIALGMDSSYAEKTLNMLAEEKTLMPLVFGLHLMNNGIVSSGVTREELICRLLELQLEDGGWAVIGKTCDADCTAMTLQALAPLYNSDDRIRVSVDRGLTALSGIQLDNGGFTGLGMESSESCAQVLLALSCLGIDCEKDERFLQNENSVLDALLRFRQEDGSFQHALGKGFNETATVQAFYSLVGYLRMLRGESSYYLFDKRDRGTEYNPEGIQAGNNDKAGMHAENNMAGNAGDVTAFSENGEKGNRAAAGDLPPRKILLYAGIALLGLLACIVSRLRGRRNWRTFVFIAAVTILVMLTASQIHIQSTESYYTGTIQAGTEIRTSISIRCDTVAGKNEYAPPDGVILTETEIRIPEGGTAFDQLAEATRIYRIQMEYDGTTVGAYVRGIAWLYEYDFGNLSGWMYRINGEFADVGASQYALREGDRVEWVYSTNIGKDVQ